jgi:SAM-dependent methyltransferase
LAEFELWEKINSWPLALEDCRNQECPSLQDRYTLYAMHTPVTSDWIPLEALEWKSEKQTDKKWKKTGESVVNRVVRDTVLAYQPQVSSLNILDVGCGLGGTLYSMLLFKGQLTYNGISPSLPEINQARQLSELHQLSSKKVHFERQSFDESINQSFNTMLAIESLSYSPNLNLTLKNLAKNLESRGILVIVDDIITPWAANEPNIEELRTTSARPSLLTNEEWKKSLSSNGFVIKETRDLSLEFDLPGVQNQRRNVRFAGFWKNLAVVAEKLYGKGDTMNQKANIRTIQLFQDYFTRLKTEELRGDGYCRAHLSYFMIICYRK